MKNCHSLGASVWTEVWCKTTPKSDTMPVKKTHKLKNNSENKGGDSCAQSKRSPIIFGLMFILLTLIVRLRLGSARF